jgi:hypothetical protein
VSSSQGYDSASQRARLTNKRLSWANGTNGVLAPSASGGRSFSFHSLHAEVSVAHRRDCRVGSDRIHPPRRPDDRSQRAPALPRHIALHSIINVTGPISADTRPPRIHRQTAIAAHGQLQVFPRNQNDHYIIIMYQHLKCQLFF